MTNEQAKKMLKAKLECPLCYEQGNMGEQKEALDLAIKALEQQRWIPVSKKMPKPRIDVWCNSDMGQMVGYYDEYAETWYGRDYMELIVTAWMPLPEPYREERTEE